MSWLMCTSGSAVVRAGFNANATIVASGSALAGFSDDVEDAICKRLGITAAASYPKIFSDLASDMIAQKIINYDADAIGKGVSTLRLNVLEQNISNNFATLKKSDILQKAGLL